LLHAETPAQLRLAHKQNESAKRLDPIRDRLIQLVARIEAAIDFVEDMDAQQNLNWENEFRTQVEQVRQNLVNLLSSTRKGMLIRGGMRVVLIGRTNVGKSSLMNQLGMLLTSFIALSVFSFKRRFHCFENCRYNTGQP
jgi:tRNA modification GTPase